MTFDKKAYNREYYRRHKDLWEKYRDGESNSGSYSQTNKTYPTTARPEYKTGAGAGASRIGSSAISSVLKEKSKNRYGKYSQNAARMMGDKMTGTSYEYRKELESNTGNKKWGYDPYSQRGKDFRRYKPSDYSNLLTAYAQKQKSRRQAEVNAEHDKNNPALKYDSKKGRYVGRSKIGTQVEKVRRSVAGPAKTYADYWKTGAKSIKSGITGAAKSYGSAWKTGAKTISKSAQKAKKKAAKFIAKLFG